MRGHGGHIGKVDRDLGLSCFWVVMQVELLNDLGYKEHIEYAIVFGGAEPNGLARESASCFEILALVSQPTICIDSSHFYGRGIFDRWQRFGKAALAGFIARYGRLLSQRLVRALSVINWFPMIKGLLNMAAVGPTSTDQNFGLERTMETFLLALSLRVIGSAVTNAHAQAHEPYV